MASTNLRGCSLNLMGYVVTKMCRPESKRSLPEDYKNLFVGCPFGNSVFLCSAFNGNVLVFKFDFGRV
jgi:hypothetical protein